MSSRRISAAVAALALAASFAVSPISETLSASAYEYRYKAVQQGAKIESGDYTYQVLDDGNAYLYSYNGKAETVTLPETIDGKKVTRVSNLLFNDNKTVKQVTFGSNILRFDDGSFTGNGIFAGCKTIEKVTFPDNLEAVPEYCFRGCTALKEVNIPNSVTEIGLSAFKGCTSLSEVTVPSACNLIQPGAFGGCTGLKKITIPKNCQVGYEESSLHNWDAFEGIHSSVTIYCYAGSSAQEYAKKYNVKYSLIEEAKTSIAKATVKAKNVYYNGKKQDPAVTVKVGGKTLVKGTDYTVTYKNNKKPGKATFTVTGKGSYSGVRNGTFIIKPAQVKKLSAKSKKRGKATIKWKRDKMVSGYQLSISVKKNFKSGTKSKLIKKNKTVGLNVKGLKPGKKYYVRIRAFKTVGKTKYFGKYTSVKAFKVKK